MNLTLFAEGQGFALPRVRAMLAEDTERYSDLCGSTVGMVMPLLDWRIRDMPFCVTACHEKEVVGAAWAGTVTSRETSAIGCNISYGVRPDFSGQGLATILSAIAYQQCAASEPMLEFVNVQTEAGNDGAQVVAERLQLARAPTFDRKTNGRAPRLYVTYRAAKNLVAARCEAILAAACINVSPLPVRPVTRRAQPVQPRIELPPSIATLLPPRRGSTMPHSHTLAAARAAAPCSATSKARADNETLHNALAGHHGLLPGIALVEEQLKVAQRATPADAPFPLTPTEARLHHEASASAYSHSLEMVSGDFLRALNANLGPAAGTPEGDARASVDLEEENAVIAGALFGKYGVTGGVQVIEKCLAKATRAEHADAPSPLDYEQASIWHRAQQSAYAYVLEMLCTDSLKQLEAQFPAPADPATAFDEEPTSAPGL